MIHVINRVDTIEAYDPVKLLEEDDGHPNSPTTLKTMTATPAHPRPTS
jgi:hypothetical protein